MRQQPQSITHVLVFVEDLERAKRLRTTLGNNFEVSTALSWEEFDKQLAADKADALVLALDDDNFDSALPRVEAIQSRTHALPIAVIWAGGDPAMIRPLLLQTGVSDLFMEPISELELASRLLLLGRARRAEEELRQLAIIDRVTGLFDRRYFSLRLMEETSRAKRFNRPLACMVVSLDGWEQAADDVNAGDLLLRQAAIVMQSTKRDSDVLARVGDGAEFGLLLYSTDAPGSKVLLGRLRKAMTDIVMGSGSPGLTAGISVMMPEPDVELHPEELYEQAMMALREAVQAGPGSEAVYTPDLAVKLLEAVKGP